MKFVLKSVLAHAWAFAVLVVFVSMVPAENGGATDHAVDLRDPAQVVRAYLRATYARDFVAAYRLIATEDRKVRDRDRYVRQRGAFSGFILDAAKKLSESVEITPLEQKAAGNRVQLRVRYRVPDSQKIAPVLLYWDPHRLNSLNAAERDHLLAALDRKQRDRSLELTAGEENFELIKEGPEWRVFLDWASGVKIPLRLELPASNDLQISLSRQEIVLQPGEIFEILLTIKNSTQRAITARIGHLVEPRDKADYLDFVQCGFLLPVTVQPGKEQEYSGTYMLRGNLPEGIKQLSLTYDFRILQ